MKALISPSEVPCRVVNWVRNINTKCWEPVFEAIPDASRLAQVQADTFEVAQPLFWVDCADDVVADEFYYKVSTKEILPVPAPPDIPEQAPIKA